MQRKSKFGLKIDFSRSRGDELYDLNSGKSYIDLFGQYASLPLGYSPLFTQDKTFQKEILEVSHIKPCLNEFGSAYFDAFLEQIKTFSKCDLSDEFHFCTTGGSGIEAAIKACFEYFSGRRSRILRFTKSFHGITGYTSFLTDRNSVGFGRLDNMPNSDFDLLDPDSLSDEEFLELAERKVNQGLIAGILVEPVRCTAGDLPFPISKLKIIKELSEKYEIPLIFDEVQVGFGVSGEVWYSDYLGIKPDVICFGKKSQVSGVLIKNHKLTNVFSRPQVFEITWDGDHIDMLRSTYIMKEILEFDLLKRIGAIGKALKDEISKLSMVTGVRGTGGLLAFDMASKVLRDRFVKSLFAQGVLVNPTGEMSVRLRPHFHFSSTDKTIEKFQQAEKNLL